MKRKGVPINDARHSDDRFLLNQTEAAPEKGVVRSKTEPFGIETFRKRFPQIPMKDALRRRIAKEARSLSSFGILALRVDETADTEPGEKRLIDVVKSIHAVCMSAKGVWGMLERNLFIGFLPKTDAKGCEAAALEIRRSLAEKGKQTLTIGAAIYPTAYFEKDAVMENARKALIHAGFLGPDSLASFDSVSLNISGDRLYQNGDIKGAVAEYLAALALDAGNVNVFNSLGVCYGELDQHEKALESFESVIRLKPADVMAHYNAGRVRLLLGDPEGALESFLRADECKEEVFEVRLQIGALYLGKKDPGSALPYLESAERLRPDSGAVHRHMGEYYLLMKDGRKAITAFKKAVKKNPCDAAALSELGVLYDIRGENPEISTLFCRHSVELAPENGLFRYRLGRLYEKQEKLQAALAEYETAALQGHGEASMRMEAIRGMLRKKAG